MTVLKDHAVGLFASRSKWNTRKFFLFIFASFSTAKLAYIDTDSFVYLIETKKIYADMAANISAFDTSEYLTTHPLH